MPVRLYVSHWLLLVIGFVTRQFLRNCSHDGGILVNKSTRFEVGTSCTDLLNNQTGSDQEE